jgi:transposase
MAIVTLGIGLTKNVFALHRVDAAGKAVLVRPNVARSKLLELVASLPPCLIGMEACSGAYYWARLFQTHGHTVRLMAPRFVVPYRLSRRQGKNDAADVATIREAVSRPAMRFVQSIAWRSSRSCWGSLSKYGTVLPLNAVTVRRVAMQPLEDGLELCLNERETVS